MTNTPKPPRSAPVVWLFAIIVALTLLLGLIAMFRASTPTPEANPPAPRAP